MHTDKQIHKAEEQILLQDFPANPDPRIFAATKFKAKKAGMPPKMATASSSVQIEKEKATFPIPAHAALCLNLSNQAFLQLNKIKNDQMFAKTSYGLSSEGGLPVLFDFFEYSFVNVVFAFTALEAYANQIIPDEFVFSRERQDKKCKEYFDKQQIERHLSLDTKLAEVLPEILQVEFKKGTKLWNDYSALREARDRIIHVKTSDLGIHAPDVKNIWTILFDRRTIDSSLVAHSVIKHFPIKNDNFSPVAAGRNRWVSFFPFKRM